MRCTLLVVTLSVLLAACKPAAEPAATAPAAAPPAADAATPAPAADPVQWAQLTIEQRVIIRVPMAKGRAPTRVVPKSDERWEEKKGPRCVALRSIRGASIVVSKAGTAVVSAAELRTVLNHQDQRDDHRDGLILSRADARAVRGAWRDQGLSVGVTHGCVDLLHPGHVALLREAASHCDRLIVGLNSDASVRRLKGETRPIQSEGARAEVMAAIRHVDAVVLFEEDTPYELIAALEPDVLVKGADYQEHQIVGADLVRAKGGIIVRVELRAGHSTTGLVDRSRTPSA